MRCFSITSRIDLMMTCSLIFLDLAYELLDILGMNVEGRNLRHVHLPKPDSFQLIDDVLWKPVTYQVCRVPSDDRIRGNTLGHDGPVSDRNPVNDCTVRTNSHVVFNINIALGITACIALSMGEQVPVRARAQGKGINYMISENEGAVSCNGTLLSDSNRR